MTSTATSDLRATRLVFFLLCCFLASQMYTLPVLVVGPWAMWPTLPDVVFVGLVGAWIITPRSRNPVTGNARKILVAFTLLTAVVCLSYVLFTLLAFNLDSVSFASNQGVGFGFFECVRMVQVLVLAWIAVSVPLPQERITKLRRIATAVAWIVCLSVIATYVGVIETSQLAPHIVNDEAISGAWWHYVNNHNSYGLGAISYTHANVAAHILLLVGFTVHLAGDARWKSNAPLLLIALLATLLTGSRAGFVAMALVVGVYLIRRSPRWIFNMSLAGAAIALFVLVIMSSSPPAPGDSQSAFLAMVDRQAAALQPFESGNLVGRGDIWAGRIDALNHDPIRWLIGWGFGSSPDTGPGLSPHMMFLQIIVELGLWMLVVICVWFAWLLTHLWRAGGQDKVMFWTTVALLLSSLTQETFYPVPSTGVFLAVYMLSVIITLCPFRQTQMSESRSQARLQPSLGRMRRAVSVPPRITDEIGSGSVLRRQP